MAMLDWRKDCTKNSTHNRQLPDHRTFQHVFYQLCKSGTLRVNRHNAARGRHVRRPDLEATVLDAMEENPHQCESCSAPDWCELHDCVEQCAWIPTLPLSFAKGSSIKCCRLSIMRSICAIVSATNYSSGSFSFSCAVHGWSHIYTREGVFDVHNSHLWSQGNPRGARPHAYQRYGVMFWQASSVTCWLDHICFLLDFLISLWQFTIWCGSNMMGPLRISALMCGNTWMLP